jgi:hypothetical protein
MKAFTSIEQSKKLAKILPLESADMKWYFWKNEIDAPKTPTFGYSKDAAESYKDTEAVYLPCWSLAALFSVIPEGIIANYYTPNIQKENGKYSIAYGNDELLCIADNPVDACYEMILKLNELKML